MVVLVGDRVSFFVRRFYRAVAGGFVIRGRLDCFYFRIIFSCGVRNVTFFILVVF